MNGQVERRLAAIMVADVVGYSRLMEADEAGVFTRQRAHVAECLEPAIRQRRGRVVKHLGDGLLAEFQSVVDAVSAAVAIQRDMAAREADHPESGRIRYRIGVNLGDVIVETDDLFGDGVNIAARLEALAVPGGICISGAAYDQMKSNLDVTYEALGAVAVKNIAEPVRAYRVHFDGAGAPAATARLGRRQPWMRGAVASAALVLAGAAAYWGMSDPSPPLPPESASAPGGTVVAVLPFSNLSNDTDQDYFVAGVTEDIATELSKISGLSVVSGTAIRSFGEQEVDLARLADSFGVDRVLAGSIRRADDRLRITARLVDPKTGRQLWAERYDRDLQDVFAVQDEIAARVATQVPGAMAVAGAETQGRAAAPDVRAYDAYIYGRARRIPPTPANLASALASFEEAMAIDPDFAGGYSGAAFVHLLAYERPNLNADAASAELSKAAALAERAVTLDPTFGPGWAALSDVRFRGGDFDGALDAIRRAVGLAPADSLMRAYLGRLLAHAGEPETGVGEVKAAMRMSPDSLPMLFFLGAAYRAAGRFDEAIAALEEHRTRLGERIMPQPTAHLIASYAAAGREADAHSLARRLLTAAPGYSLEIPGRTPYRDPDAQAAFLDALTQAGIPNHPAAPAKSE